MSNLARRYTLPRGVRRLAFAATLLGGFIFETVKQAIRPTYPAFDLQERDVEDDMPFTVERYRWTQGGSS